MKKKIFWCLGIVVILAVMSINFITTNKANKQTSSLKLTEISAGADGTCCPEQGSYCVIGDKNFGGYFFKGWGSCNA
jgi:hypothetical protein